MNLWGVAIILFGPGAVTWLFFGIQSLIAIMFGAQPWCEPMSTALYVTGAWWAAVGGVWLFLVTMTTLERWWTR